MQNRILFDHMQDDLFDSVERLHLQNIRTLEESVEAEHSGLADVEVAYATAI